MARKHTHPYPAGFRKNVVEAEFKLAGQTFREWIE